MFKRLGLLAALSFTSIAVQAQSSVTLYGILDQYIAYERSSSGKSVVVAGDGGPYPSRFGLRGVESLGDGYKVVFQLEGGFNPFTGKSDDSSRLFDRQAWVGVETPVGAFRFGRQNTTSFYSSDALDYTYRGTLGSPTQNFGFPARYDNDIAYISPRIQNFKLELHYAIPGIAGSGLNRGAVYQVWIDYTSAKYRAGYVGIFAPPISSAVYKQIVQYHEAYFDYTYGPGKIYFAYVHSNNSTSSPNGNNALGILSSVSIPNNYVPGTTADIQRFYNVFSLSVDYQVTPSLRVGTVVGEILEQGSSGNRAFDANAGAIYSLSKRTSIYGYASVLKNQNNAGFRMLAPGSLPGFVAADVNGRTLMAFQFGITHFF